MANSSYRQNEIMCHKTAEVLIGLQRINMKVGFDLTEINSVKEWAIDSLQTDVTISLKFQESQVDDYIEIRDN